MSSINAGFNSFTTPAQAQFSGASARTSTPSESEGDSFAGTKSSRSKSALNFSLFLGLDIALTAGLIYLFGGKEALQKYLPKLENSCVGKFLITPAKACWNKCIGLFSKAEKVVENTAKAAHVPDFAI